MSIILVPVQVTTVQYSSDERIKKDIEDVDTLDLLDRMRDIELREYGYTDEWRSVRGLSNDIRVRGVIAQELRQVFPEHIQVLDELDMEDDGINFKDFHQVDKQGLVLDLVGALQAHTDYFQVFTPTNADKTRSVAVVTADLDPYDKEFNESGDVSVMTGSAANKISGNVFVESGDASKSGNVEITVGASFVESGVLTLKGGSSTTTEGGQAQMYGGTSEVGGSGGSVIVGGGSSLVEQGGDAWFGSGSSQTKSGGDTLLTSGSGPLSGGVVTIESGSSIDEGGSLSFLAGEAVGERDALGGSIVMKSGSSSSFYSGSIEIESGGGGVSGSISIASGASTDGPSGAVGIGTSDTSTRSETSGSIFLSVGSATEGGEGGSLNMSAGASSSSSSKYEDEDAQIKCCS